MGCTKAQGFLEQHNVQVSEQTDAKKDKKGRAETLTLAHDARRVIVAKGKKSITFDMKKSPPDDETLAAHLLGPTGNLRAPSLRIGDALLVGFSAEAYRSLLTAGGPAEH
jgi:hypothetical protein